MPNQNDSNLTRSRFGLEERIIDTYDLITSIVVGFEGQASLKIKIDNQLPLIKGDPDQVEASFKDFINKAIEQFNGTAEEVSIIHIKNPHAWIFAFFIKGFQYGDQNHKHDTISEFNLCISKKS
ncbi:hypothetical protein [uncultured Algoriphagus sp.]|uniref:hypothetical protein n=1 Tax=uncultured Algoriphagus sp. TaxID=417365 RepID=UPI0030EC07D3|tara:strand:- start:140158 stop:140529 length:372 start_codon:yes stop_codon:yes gene_type:complete